MRACVCVYITVVAFKEHADKMRFELADSTSNCGLLTYAMEKVHVHALPIIYNRNILFLRWWKQYETFARKCLMACLQKTRRGVV